MSSSVFLQELTAIMQRQRTTVAADWATLPDAALAAQPGPGRWSALECVEHLNRYSRYYNPALAAALGGFRRPPALTRPQGPYATAGWAASRWTWCGRLISAPKKRCRA